MTCLLNLEKKDFLLSIIKIAKQHKNKSKQTKKTHTHTKTQSRKHLFTNVYLSKQDESIDGRKLECKIAIACQWTFICNSHYKVSR